jgi:hypothetical protein
MPWFLALSRCEQDAMNAAEREIEGLAQRSRIERDTSLVLRQFPHGNDLGISEIHSSSFVAAQQPRGFDNLTR